MNTDYASTSFRDTLRVVKSAMPRYLYLLTAAIFICTLLIFWKPGRAKAASTVSTSTSANATTGSYQRKTFYDSATSRYWAFYYNGTAIAYSNSTDGNSWSAIGTIAENSNDFSVANTSGTVFIAYMDPAGPIAQKGTLSSSSISWGSANTVTSLSSAPNDINIAIDGNNKLWVDYTYTASGNVNTGVKQSTNALDPSSWGAEQGLWGHRTTTLSDIENVVMVPMSTAGNMYFISADFNSLSGVPIAGVLYTSATKTYSSSSTIFNASADGSFSAVPGPSDTISLVYADSGSLYYAHYSSGAWGTASAIDSSSADSNPNLSYDASGNLYAAWINSNTIEYKKGVSPYGSGNWDASPTTVYSTGTNAALNSSYTSGNNTIQLTWANGTASPYNVMFGTISTGGVSNSPPGTPTLSAPASGATGVSTSPQFQMSTTDPNSDYIEYRVYLYQSDCATAVGASPFTETVTQTGWSGQNANTNQAYSSGSTATYTYQGSLAGSTTYCWKADAIDPGGSNTYSSASATQSFTTGSQSSPSAPSLIMPASGATSVSQGPAFQLRASDAEGDYLRYKIIIYNSDCSTGAQTYDETASQTGWANQDQQSGTAYTGSASINSSRVADFFLTGLNASTTYCWKAAAIDPGGSNSFGSYSSTQLFTTGSGSGSLNINGGSQINGGSVVR